ncbi:MAG: hypothetical protein ACE5HB_08265, partial [Terriglobia bacterium]
MPDYIFMLESRLAPEQLRALNRAQQEAQELSLNIYLVGGAVRDLMTGAPIGDLDFVVEGNPHRLARRLASDGAFRFDTDQATHSAELTLAEGVRVSVAMARTDIYRKPGQPPESRPAPILEDLRRRDFSLNAMGVSLTPGSRGLLLDPTNGLADIETRELRVLHNYSFVHDPVRLFRLLRFSLRLGFKAEPRTQELFESALERSFQDSIRPATLGAEFEQIAREANVVAVLKALAARELLEVFHPRLARRKPDYDGLAKWQKYRLAAQEQGYRPDSLFAVLHYVRRRLPVRAQNTLLVRLSFSKAQRTKAAAFEGEVRKLVKQVRRLRHANPKQIYDLLEPVPVERLVFALANYSSQRHVQAKIYNYLFKYRPLRHKLPARELQLMGVAPGPKFDQILEKYFQALLLGKLRGRPHQLRFLREAAGLPKVKPKPVKKSERPAPKSAQAAAAHGKGPGVKAAPAAARKLVPAPKRKPAAPA